MAYLNPKALAIIAEALQDVIQVYDKLAEDKQLPARMRSTFSEYRHMASILQELFERHPDINAEGVDTAEFRAFIWEAAHRTVA